MSELRTLHQWFLDRRPFSKHKRPARMVRTELAREYYKFIAGDPSFEAVTRGKGRYRLVGEQFYLTFSPKDKLTHVLLGKV